VSGYADILEFIAQRQMGILGPVKTADIFQEAGVPIQDGGRLAAPEGASYARLEALAAKLHEKYGMVPIMGCKLPVARMARDRGLELPRLFK
jgi:hypothetical protein